jgi:hypothetical protein
MKLVVRAFAFTLVAVGAFASTHTTRSKTTVEPKANSQVVSSFVPVPTCMPTSGCGVIK